MLFDAVEDVLLLEVLDETVVIVFKLPFRLGLYPPAIPLKKIRHILGKCGAAPFLPSLPCAAITA